MLFVTSKKKLSIETTSVDLSRKVFQEPVWVPADQINPDCNCCYGRGKIANEDIGGGLMSIQPCPKCRMAHAAVKG